MIEVTSSEAQIPRRVIELDADSPTLATALDEAIVDANDAAGNGPDRELHVWIAGVTEPADQIVRSAGFEPYRDLWQLRCRLPAEPSDLHTRSYTPADLASFIAVNNRAFSWHPEQGGLTPERVDATMSEPWFDPDGFRLYEEDGQLVGFCWTKIHADTEPALGEIFVIAVDPSAHGRGLGSPMTRAGLDWLAAQGLATGMLYVESDNDAANRVYERIGFVHHQTNRAYRQIVD